MTAKKNGTSPDKGRKYDVTFKAEALRRESFNPSRCPQVGHQRRHSGRYSTRRLRTERQVQVGCWRSRRTLAAHHVLRAQQPRSFVLRITNSDAAVWAAPNCLSGQPAPAAPNQV
ncbi:hypothetical protein [Hymenobacter cavernae]|uniref:hypothetical protein n=1 Tax=Hymenobacter cavernae TaxID=2044852 RepID=UPI0016630308|nr:hypothetical protein [Hymenobacter cavernae]